MAKWANIYPRNVSIKKAVTANTKPFAELVKEHSDDPAAKTNGGTTNWIILGEPNKRYPKEVTDALFKLDLNATTPTPIDGGQWLYFIKLIEKREGTVTPFEQAKSRIAQQLVRKNRLDAYDNLVESLQSKHAVQTFPEKVKEALQSTNKSDGPPPGPAPTPK